MKKTLREIREAGISLLEVLLSVGIISIILLTGVYFFDQIEKDTAVTKSITLLQKIASASYEWLQAQKQMDFCGATSSSPTSCPTGKVISIQALISAGLITPYDTCSSTPCLLTPWGKPITVEPAIGTGGSGPQYIRVTFPSVPNSIICSQILQNMQNNSPTKVQSDCSKDPTTGNINYFVEL